MIRSRGHLRWRFPLAWIVVGLVLQLGCTQPSRPERRTHSTAVSVASYDDSKSRLPLDRICPLPEFHKSTHAASLLSDAGEAARRQFERGLKRFEDRRWADAMAAFKQAIESDAGLSEARVLFARAAIRLGDFPAARNALSEALSCEPRNAAAHQLLGEMAYRERKSDEAIRELRLAIAASTETTAESVLAHLTLARVLQDEGYTLAAAEQYDAYLAATATPTAAMTAHTECGEAMALQRVSAPTALGELRASLGEFEKAVSAFRRAADAAPNETLPRRRWILALAQAGHAEEALKAARHEAAGGKGGDVALDFLKQICAATGDASRFDDEVQKLAQDSKDPGVGIDMARIMVGQKQFDEAAAILSQLVGDDAVGDDAAWLLAEIRVEQGDVAAAYALILELVRRDPTRMDERVRWMTGPVRDRAVVAAFVNAAESAATRQSKDGIARILHGRLLAATGAHDAAVRELEAAVRLMKPPGLAYGALALSLCESKSWEAAIQAAEKAIDAGVKSREVYLALGTAKAALDDFDGAQQAFLSSFDLDREWAEPLYRLAEMAERRGRLREAEQLYRRILDDVDPRQMSAREKLVVLYLNSGDYEKSREYFSDFDALALKGGSVDRCRALLALSTSSSITPNERLNEYLTALRTSLENYPRDWRTYIEIARSHSAVGDYPSALESADQALAIAPDDLPARELKADLLTKLLRFDEAALIVHGLLKDRPRDLSYMQELLQIAENAGDWTTAADLLRGLIAREDLKDQRPALTNLLITSLIQAENWEDAVATAKAWLDDAPDDVLRRSTYLRTLGRAGRHDEAIAEATSLLKNDPQSRTLQIELLSRLQDAKRPLEAIQHTIDWLAAAPDDLDLNAALIRLCWSAKRWDDAIEMARSGMELNKNRVVYETLLGESYRFAGRFDDAIRLSKDKYETCIAKRRKLEKALRKGAAPQDATRALTELQTAINESKRANLSLIGVMILAERYRAAERQINKTLRPELEAMKAGRAYDQPMMIDMRNLLSEVYADTDRPAQALQQLEAIYELDPTDPGVNNNLGYQLADMGQDLERAEKMIRFSLAQNPNSHASLDSLGWVLYKRGRYEEAAYYIRQALKMSSAEDPVLHDHLGDALYRKGEAKTAEAEWKTAIRMCAPDYDPPPDHDRRLLHGVLKSKLEAIEQGKIPAAAAIVVETTSQPAATTSQPAATTP